MGIQCLERVRGWSPGEGVKMPPDLSEAERPLAMIPLQSSQETACDSPPPRLAAESITTSIGKDGRGVLIQEQHPLPRPAAESADSNTGKGGGGHVHQLQGHQVGSRVGDMSGVTSKVGEAEVASTNVCLYRLSPALRATFASVGAIDAAYPFREILLMLKQYLYSKRHLFDPEDVLYVNCGDDELGKTFGVSRFHYNDVKSLMAKQVTRELPRSLQNTFEQSPDTTGADSWKAHRIFNNSCTQRVLDCSDGSTCNANVERKESATNDRTEHTVLDTCVVSSTTAVNPVSNGLFIEKSQGDSSHKNISPIPGTSRHYSENVIGERRRRRSRSVTSYTIDIPDIPDSNSDAESIHSYQGYETAFCRNTEFEESEDEEDESELFEEYEVADDDDDNQEVEQSDVDSVIEDVEVALLAIHAFYQDESDEDFWADASDTEDQSTDDDPELVAERWDCLSCGLKNKPFVRYCGKCWQLRKNWLPDRPKKRRRKRKQRPKKKQRIRSDSVQSEDMFSQTKSEENLDQHPPFYTSENSQELQEFAPLIKSTSTASTVSFSASPERTLSFDTHSSQDSGICLSQDCQDFMMGDTEKSERKPETDSTSQSSGSALRTEAETESTNESGSETQPSTSEESSAPSSRTNAYKRNTEGSTSGRKRKSSPEEDCKPSKYSKYETSSEEESEEGEVTEEQAEKFYKFLQSSSGKEWLKSPDSKPFLSSPPVKEALMSAIVANMCSDSSGTGVQDQPSGLSIMCSICFLRPKNASIIHGRLSHQATCYQCARRLLDNGDRCPVCRRKIHMVCKHIIA